MSLLNIKENSDVTEIEVLNARLKARGRTFGLKTQNVFMIFYIFPKISFDLVFISDPRMKKEMRRSYPSSVRLRVFQ